jgi:hypothetical protein
LEVAQALTDWLPIDAVIEAIEVSDDSSLVRVWTSTPRLVMDDEARRRRASKLHCELRSDHRCDLRSRRAVRAKRTIRSAEYVNPGPPSPVAPPSAAHVDETDQWLTGLT